jgi:hypothetical protein
MRKVYQNTLPSSMVRFAPAGQVPNPGPSQAVIAAVAALLGITAANINFAINGPVGSALAKQLWHQANTLRSQLQSQPWSPANQVHIAELTAVMNVLPATGQVNSLTPIPSQGRVYNNQSRVQVPTNLPRPDGVNRPTTKVAGQATPTAYDASGNVVPVSLPTGWGWSTDANGNPIPVDANNNPIPLPAGATTWIRPTPPAAAGMPSMGVMIGIGLVALAVGYTFATESGRRTIRNPIRRHLRRFSRR